MIIKTNTQPKSPQASLLILLSLLWCSLLIFNSPAHAVIEAVKFDNPQYEERYQDLISELRCLVCQNQNLADSDAELAKDLRNKTAEMLEAGKSNAEILEYMRERYGDFVLYRPPFSLATALLWLGPFALLLLIIIAVLVSVKKRHNQVVLPTEIDDQQLQKVRKLIDDQ